MESTKNELIEEEIAELLGEFKLLNKNKVEKNTGDDVERYVWEISKTDPDFKNYFRDIKNDLRKIKDNNVHNSFMYEWDILDGFLTDLCKNLKAENEEDKIDDPILKLKLNILISYLFSPSINDLNIIEYYEKSNKKAIGQELTILAEITFYFKKLIVLRHVDFFEKLDKKIGLLYEKDLNTQEEIILKQFQSRITENIKNIFLYNPNVEPSEIIKSERKYLNDLTDFYDYIKNANKENDKKILLSVINEIFVKNELEIFESYFNCKDKLLELMNDNTMNE